MIFFISKFSLEYEAVNNRTQNNVELIIPKYRQIDI